MMQLLQGGGLKCNQAGHRAGRLCVCALRNLGNVVFSARVYNDGGFLSSKILSSDILVCR